MTVIPFPLPRSTRPVPRPAIETLDGFAQVYAGAAPAEREAALRCAVLVFNAGRIRTACGTRAVTIDAMGLRATGPSFAEAAAAWWHRATTPDRGVA